jgi:hypothetical protein
MLRDIAEAEGSKEQALSIHQLFSSKANVKELRRPTSNAMRLAARRAAMGALHRRRLNVQVTCRGEIFRPCRRAHGRSARSAVFRPIECLQAARSGAAGADSAPQSVYGLRDRLKRKRAMDETRAVAHLPNLDIEILHRQLPDERAEQLLISLRARPSFEAFGRWLDAPGPAVAWLALSPLLAWQQAALALWAPWLKAAPRALPEAASRTKGRGAER